MGEIQEDGEEEGQRDGERAREEERERYGEKKRSRGKACCSVMLLLKCRASRPLVEAIKRKK